ncbi:Calmodulin-binding domain plant [Arabidopsis thaliana x Arabidopsis arenosa]|uniref:Calmodulin-binding domain plant n=1 Tax=Arabidopsis thaliana x Arabidopsis arenosa TaxID=1240361 RepID=A0A8T1ZRH9_9BRAS|nr:Calmodulin-binding domain plant [Arabidopsis thaliana x Arabidopsis arenosa]
MVQRKTAQALLGQGHGRRLGPEMMKKRPRASRLPQPTTPEKQIVAKVTGGSPNYMKGTRSSEARRQSQSVQAGIDKKSQTGKKLVSCTRDKKLSSSSNKSLKKGLSFKRSGRSSRCGDVSAHRATCSSFLKNSKFTEDMMLTSPAVLKVCPYTYCSLNAHLHRQFPPIQSFISTRRRFLKSHAGMKMSGECDDGCVEIYVDEEKENRSTRETDSKVIDSKAENMEVEWEEAEDLDSESAEMVSLLEGEGIESCGYGNENIGMMTENFAILEQSENSSEDQEREEGGFSDNTINSLLSEQDDIILGNALDEKLDSKETEGWKAADGEKVKEQIKLASKTEETLLSLAQKPCNREEYTEDWRGFNPREPNYIQTTAEPSSETVDLKHQDMDESSGGSRKIIYMGHK